MKHKPLFVIGDKEIFIPTDKQFEFMAAQETNVFMWGNRGGGKSICARQWCHAMAMAHPGLIYIVVRRSFPELTKNHLVYLPDEMKMFGGSWNKTEHIASYPNGSVGFYSQCASDNDVKKVVGAEAAIIIFDEAPEMEWNWIRLIGASVRVKKNSGLKPKVRYLGNPIGPSIDKLFAYFGIEGEVDPAEDPEYNPRDWKSIEIRLEDNPHLDAEEYKKQFAGIPAAYRQAWLDGIKVVEGAYFVIDPKIHHTTKYPNLNGALIYRAVDWGWHDSAVVLWIANYPDGRSLVFKERSFTHTTAAEVAKVVKEESRGMRVITTFADPSMFPPEGSDLVLSATIFEQNGIPLTRSRNDRTAAGYAISEFLNTTLADGQPKLQIYTPNAPMLTKTLPNMRSDPNNPGRIADGNDHWTMALGYYCMGSSATPRVKAPAMEVSRVQQLIRQTQTQPSSRWWER